MPTATTGTSAIVTTHWLRKILTPAVVSNYSSAQAPPRSRGRPPNVSHVTGSNMPLSSKSHPSTSRCSVQRVRPQYPKHCPTILFTSSSLIRLSLLQLSNQSCLLCYVHMLLLLISWTCILISVDIKQNFYAIFQLAQEMYLQPFLEARHRNHLEQPDLITAVSCHSAASTSTFCYHFKKWNCKIYHGLLWVCCDWSLYKGSEHIILRISLADSVVCAVFGCAVKWLMYVTVWSK
jgi:hypothetical protein